MPSPFPGMDPYLEDPGLWPDVHLNLILGCQALLAAQLRPKYVVRVEEKRREIMYSPSHWVEIDLLRGSRLVRVPKKVGPHEYLIHVSKKGLRPRGLLYPSRLSQRLPVVPIPLKASDPDARLDLQSVLDTAYDRACYDLEIDYRRKPVPPLIGKLAEWADQLLRSKGLR
jgi:Protein of unknown function (DUF4058)